MPQISETQAVIFFRPDWNVTKARRWLKKHNIVPLKPPDTKLFKRQIRFRITPPEQYKRFITKKLADNLHLIIGFKEKPKAEKAGSSSRSMTTNLRTFKPPTFGGLKRRRFVNRTNRLLKI